MMLIFQMSWCPGRGDMPPDLMEFLQDSDSEESSTSDHDETVQQEFLDDGELETLEDARIYFERGLFSW